MASNSCEALNGGIAVLAWCIHVAQEYQFCECLSEAAAEHGHLDMLMWLREHECPVDIDDCMAAAEEGGHVAVVEWLNQFIDDATW